jgi:ATP-dependent Clp protease ATP-binding subunit ClpA
VLLNEADAPLRLAEATERIVGKAAGVANDMNHTLVGTEHLLIALLESPNTGARAILERQGLTAETIREELGHNG